MDVCTGAVGNSDRTIYVRSPRSAQKLVAAQVLSDATLCGAAGTPATDVGPDIAVLGVDLSKIDTPALFQPWPIGSKQAQTYSDFKVEGFRPTGVFQSITGIEGDAPDFAPQDKSQASSLVYVVTAAPEQGYSGAPVLGMTTSGFAVIGVMTNYYPYWDPLPAIGGSQPVAADTLNAIIDRALLLKESSALNGLALDLAYLRPMVPPIPPTAQVTALLDILAKPQTAQNASDAYALATKLSTIEQAIFIREYAKRKAQGAIQTWALVPGLKAETQWCWDTGYFENEAYKLSQLTVRSSGDKVALADVGRSLATEATVDPRSNAKILRASYTLLTAATQASTSKQLLQDQAIVAIRLANATSSPKDTSTALDAIKMAEAAGVSTNAFVSSAADFRVRTANYFADETTSRVLLGTAIESYSRVIANSPKASDMHAQAAAGRAYANTLGANVVTSRPGL
jgi:hypothetical protein